MAIFTAIKILILAIFFVISGGALFSEWAQKHKILGFLAALVAIAGSFYLFRDIYNDLKHDVAKDVIAQGTTPIPTADSENQAETEEPKTNPLSAVEETVVESIPEEPSIEEENCYYGMNRPDRPCIPPPVNVDVDRTQRAARTTVKSGNVRSGPSIDYPVVGIIEKSKSPEILGRVKRPDRGKYWYLIRYDVTPNWPAMAESEYFKLYLGDPKQAAVYISGDLYGE